MSFHYAPLMNCEQSANGTMRRVMQMVAPTHWKNRSPSELGHVGGNLSAEWKSGKIVACSN